MPNAPDEQPPRQLRIDLDRLKEAFDLDRRRAHYLLDLKSGDILPVQDDHEAQEKATYVDPEFGPRYLSIPGIGKRDEYYYMEQFTRTVKTEQVRGLLTRALAREDPFQSFQGVLAHAPEEQQRWQSFREARIHQRALDWLSTENIEPLDS